MTIVDPAAIEAVARAIVRTKGSTDVDAEVATIAAEVTFYARRTGLLGAQVPMGRGQFLATFAVATAAVERFPALLSPGEAERLVALLAAENSAEGHAVLAWLLERVPARGMA